MIGLEKVDKMRKQTKLWTMANGGTIRICDMKDCHLENTISLIEKGDFAEYTGLDDPDGIFYDEGNYPDIYYNMLDDLERRQFEKDKARRNIQKYRDSINNKVLNK